jgi:DUF2914 family protein
MFLMTGLDFILNARTFSFGGAGADNNRPAPIAVGRRIVNREVVGGESPDCPFRAGEVLYAHSAVAGQSAGFVEHVWFCDGVEVARHYLPIGCDRRWRTWSRHRLQAGDYRIEVRAPDGRSLATHTFTAFPSG